MDNNFGTVLVIGENHEEIIKKYSADTKVPEYVVYKKSEIDKIRKNLIAYYKAMVSNDDMNLSETKKEYMNEKIKTLNEMTNNEFFEYLSDGYIVGEDGNIYSDTNPNAYYEYEKCYHKRMIASKGELGGCFSMPFKLKNGTLAYIARFDEIDWDNMHMVGTDMYKIAWEVVVEKRKPISMFEENIYNTMRKMTNYLSKFPSKDDYIKHSCAFWCYGIATEDSYEQLGEKKNDIEWVATFYDTYIKNIQGNPLLSIYEVRLL